MGREQVRQGRAIDCPLARHNVRHVGVAEERNSVRTQDSRSLKAILKIVSGLTGEAIHEIEIERRHTSIAEPIHRLNDAIFRLHTPDGFLAMIGEGLHSKACPSDSDLTDDLRPLFSHGARIQFYRKNRVVQPEVFSQLGVKFPEIVG